MELLEIIVITLQITAMFARRKHNKWSSGESIENLLYFKDCKQKHTTAAPVEMLQRMVEAPKPQPPACPCPRMCCSMCCDCNAPEGPQSFMSRQMSPLQMPSFNQAQPSPSEMSMQPGQQSISHPSMPVQPQLLHRRKKTSKNPMSPNTLAQPPISRRGLGFTKENIKSLISKDEDIKKILKDLVRVTMTKVDLVGAVNSRRSMKLSATTVDPETTGAAEDDDYMEEF